MLGRFSFVSLAILALSLAACRDNSPKATGVASIPGPGATAARSADISVPLGQLDKRVVPKHYRLELTILPEKNHFSGKTSIDLYVESPTEVIWLHGNRIDATSVKVQQGGHNISGTYKQVDKTGVAKITLDQALQSGKAVLDIAYKAPFNGALEGLYKVEEGGLTYAFTQFEATSARLAFPGFDEPLFKVPFDVSLIIDREHFAIANTPEISTTTSADGLKKITYATTKPLPTYLIFFAVGPFDVVEWAAIPANDVRDQPIPLRGVAVKGNGDQIAYALKHSAEIMASLETYFQIPYPYAKLDIIAVPDFSMGAMENAAAITYRENLLLLDENSSLTSKRSYASAHAHELAHQWFGNLVTPKWWDDIWLNEAFATWMAYTALHNLNPEDGYRKTLLSYSLSAMETDSLISSRQIRQPIESNHDIASAFDAITYSKGGGVLSMFESFIGPENFRQGIETYLNKYAYQTTTADAFINAISAEVEGMKPRIIADAFRSFLEQPGLPIMDVSTRCDEAHATIKVNQSRYLPLGSKGSSRQTWDVPLCVKYNIDGQNHAFCQLVDKPSQTIKLLETGCPAFVMPNSQGAGYYRWSLPTEGWQALLSAKEELSTEELMSASDSLDAAFAAGKLSAADYLQTIPEMIESDDWQVVVAPMGTLTNMDKYLVDPENRETFKQLLQSLYANKLDEIGLTGKTDQETIQLRQNLVNFLALHAEASEPREALIKQATDYIGYRGDNQIKTEEIDQNIIITALTVAVDELGQPFADALRARFLESRDATFRNRALSALGDTTDEKIAREAREWILSPKIRDNEWYPILYSQLSNNETRGAAWNWVKANFNQLIERMPAWRQGQVATAGSFFCSVERRNEVETFFADKIKDLEGGPRSIANTLETIELCVAWAKHNQAALNQYLRQ